MPRASRQILSVRSLFRRSLSGVIFRMGKEAKQKQTIKKKHTHTQQTLGYYFLMGEQRTSRHWYALVDELSDAGLTSFQFARVPGTFFVVCFNFYELKQWGQTVRADLLVSVRLAKQLNWGVCVCGFSMNRMKSNLFYQPPDTLLTQLRGQPFAR